MAGSRFHARIPSRQWARIRRAIFTRDKYRCRTCGRPGKLEVDHVIPLHRGGHPTDPANLQTLCGPCHIEKTSVEKGTDPEVLALRAYVRDYLRLPL